MKKKLKKIIRLNRGKYQFRKREQKVVYCVLCFKPTEKLSFLYGDMKF